MSLYLKDSINHQLYILKYNWETKAYAIEFIEDLELDDELMCIHRVNNWKNGAVKVYINEKNSKGSKFEEIIIKKDGQMTIDKSLAVIPFATPSLANYGFSRFRKGGESLPFLRERKVRTP